MILSQNNIFVNTRAKNKIIDITLKKLYNFLITSNLFTDFGVIYYDRTEKEHNMAFLSLNNIGKIYVSEKNVTVGIREVDLSFDLGEFVCVTGKSGSGKSTLLNVISGMDSYEEGELYINGEPTSHYLQQDWEEYRERYVSFIFQDYNIIDSFTVLENVELALMHIEDRAQRRKRALELIDRVGLSSHIGHKGSRLSGGQKQRTVIARALAKDSPVILADEPTGNLDSQTSKEIIDLLRQVSEDKLVIVVTHNFDDFSHCATRHIRIHDGAVEFDHRLLPTKTCDAPIFCESVDKGYKRAVKDGLTLGLSIFKSKPRLTAFLCMLMMIGTIGLFLVTSLCGGAADAFKPNYMFDDIEGRLVLTTKSGRVMTEEELVDLATEYGAESYLRFDVLLDQGGYSNTVEIPSSSSYDGYKYLIPDFTYDENFGNDIIGKYPTEKDEIFLYLPISYADEFGRSEIKIKEITVFNLPLKVCGVKYYYDNNLTPKMLFTDEGFKVATAAHYLSSCSLSITASIEGSDMGIMLYQLLPSFDIAEDKAYIHSPGFESFIAQNPDAKASVAFNAVYYKYDYFGSSDGRSMTFKHSFEPSDITNDKPTFANSTYSTDAFVISDEILVDIAYTVLRDSYKQASLFFETDKEAHRVAELLNGEEYIAVPADTTYTNDAEDAVLLLLESTFTMILWLLAVVFLAFFINLCSIRAVESFKGDIAIMRSMGIQVRTIKIGIYVRMAFCLIPAFLLLGILSILIFTSSFNAFFTYLYAWQYGLIIVGMILLTLRTTKKQIIRLFSDSVKKTIKGGAVA